MSTSGIVILLPSNFKLFRFTLIMHFTSKLSAELRLCLSLIINHCLQHNDSGNLKLWNWGTVVPPSTTLPLTTSLPIPPPIFKPQIGFFLNRSLIVDTFCIWPILYYCRMFLWSKRFVLLTLVITFGVTGDKEPSEAPENTMYRPKRRRLVAVCTECEMKDVSSVKSINQMPHNLLL